jgi:prepilin-type N-terminal cleavage/methylation domain-containing protein
MWCKTLKAMTLIEVMMALMVLALVFGGVISSMVRAASITRDSKVIYRETAIINDAIEKMRSMTFDGLKTYLVANPTIEIPPSGLGGAYTYILKNESDTTKDPIKITLTIYPKDLPQRSISLVTYISSDGLINKGKK